MTVLNRLLLTAAISFLSASPWPAAAKSASQTTYAQELVTAKSTIISSPEDAYAHAQSALALVEREGPANRDTTAYVTATWLSGEALTQTKRPERALPLLQTAVREASQGRVPPLLLGDVLKSRGRAEAATGAVQLALEDYQRAFAIFQGLKNSSGQAKALEEIGSLYLQAREYSRALQYYEEARQDSMASPILRLSADNNRGEALKGLGRYMESEAAYQQALQDARQLGSNYLQIHILENVAMTQILQGKLPQARDAVAEGMRLTSKNQEAKAERPFMQTVAANIAANEGDFAGAGALLDDAFAAGSLTKTVPEWRDSHELAARVYERLGDVDKAFTHLKTFKRLDDEGIALASSTEAALMSAKFDYANQQTRIVQLQTGNLKRDVALARSQARSTLLISAITIVGGLLLIGVMSHSLLATRRSRNEIARVNEALEDTNKALEKALNARTEFLAMTSHEIRTPLNGILGMTQVMLAKAGVEGELRKGLEIIKASGATMNDMLTDLLDIAKIERGHVVVERSQIDLVALLNDVSRMWSDRACMKGLNFNADLSHCPPMAVEDPAMLRQILANLLSNAIKFTSRGEVGLTVSTRATASGEAIVFKVSDSGIGIPKEQFDRIFEAFTQVDGGTSRHYDGAGLGLAICHNLVNTLGGSITLSSAVGEGSSFVVELPLVRGALKADDAAEVGGRFDRAVVLIVEDNPLAQAMVRSILKDRVKRLDFANSVERAPEISNSPPDVVLVDGGCVQRQAPESPFQAVAALARNFEESQIVALWPAMTADDEARLTAAGVHRALSKPITAAALISALEAACDPAQRASDARSVDDNPISVTA